MVSEQASILRIEDYEHLRGKIPPRNIFTDREIIINFYQTKFGLIDPCNMRDIGSEIQEDIN